MTWQAHQLLAMANLAICLGIGWACICRLNSHVARVHKLARARYALLLAGAVYAGIATGFAGLAYPTQAEGSLLRDGKGQVRGSAWLSQPFTGDGYFQARPSAANYDPMAAAGSNLARSNPALVAAREGVAPAQVPADLVTQSGGGLDPQLSPAAAQLQVARVARARGLPEERVQALVKAHTEGRQWGLFGQPRVNVVTLNFALDHAAKAP